MGLIRPLAGGRPPLIRELSTLILAPQGLSESGRGGPALPTMKSYDAGGRHFRTQKEFRQALQGALRSHPKNIEFEDTLLADAIQKYHKEVAKAGLAIEKFVYIDAIEPPEFDREELLRRFAEKAGLKKWNNVLVAFFTGVGWRDVTYQIWKTRDDSITMDQCKADIRVAFREIANGFLPRPTTTDRCAFEGCKAVPPTLQYQHDKPTFADIAEHCLSFMSQEEIRTRFGYVKFGPDPTKVSVSDFIPLDHAAIRYLREVHESNEWRWLCKKHHRRETYGWDGG